MPGPLVIAAGLYATIGIALMIALDLYQRSRGAAEMSAAQRTQYITILVAAGGAVFLALWLSGSAHLAALAVILAILATLRLAYWLLYGRDDQWGWLVGVGFLLAAVLVAVSQVG